MQTTPRFRAQLSWIFSVLAFTLCCHIHVAHSEETAKPALRAFAPDRPSRATGPYTIDAGHLMFEVSVLEWTSNQETADSGSSARTQALAVFPFAVRAGLLKDVEIGMSLSPWNTRSQDGITSARGLGQLQFGAKWNWAGNDSGEFAYGIFANITLPTAKSGLGTEKTEAGLGFPVLLNLSKKDSLTVTWELNLKNSDSDQKLHSEFVSVLGLSHNFTEDFGVYAEFAGTSNALANVPWVAVSGIGASYNLGPNTQIDCFANFGLTTAADDLNLGAGFSFRL